MLRCKSVFEKHGWELKEVERLHGVLSGRLFFAACILSDVQEMVYRGMDKQKIIDEINEAKELICSVRRNIVADDIKKAVETAKTPEEFGFKVLDTLFTHGVIDSETYDKIWRRFTEKEKVSLV